MRSFAEHLSAPRGEGALTDHPHSGAAGGAPCGDLVRIAVRIEGDRVAEAGFDAHGCGAVTAAASAIVESIEGGSFLSACRLNAGEVAKQLGGLSPPKRHAAELAADALHRALGAAAKDQAAAKDGAVRLEPSPRRTLVAMSGGVDSAAAAQLALDAGDEVVAVTLELWSDPGTDGELSCCSPQAVRGARELAHRMGIPHVTLDLRERFRAEVVDPFLDGYAEGRTPNPCVRCNGEVRFDALLELAGVLGAARLATGHYARIARDERGPLIREAADPRKDQSYMLAKLDPAVLDRLSFPLGGLTKDAVRALAREAGLPVADKRESQDLCFVAGLGGRAFLQRHGGPRLRRRGEIVDRSGKVLGRHDGQHNFTVGQRRGLGLATPEPLYVLKRDADTNRVVVGPRSALATDRVPLENPSLHRPPQEVERVRLRYHAEPIPCRVHVQEDGALELELDESANGVAPGQLACLMRQDRVVGEGTIGEPR
jgi:tRNA-specific 2-thiouridylase